MQHIVALSYKKNYTEAMSKKRSDKTSSYTSDQNREKSSVQPSRPGGRSARVQAAVFEATLELLQEQGYEALSIPAIAERATGCGAGAPGTALRIAHLRGSVALLCPGR